MTLNLSLLKYKFIFSAAIATALSWSGCKTTPVPADNRTTAQAPAGEINPKKLPLVKPEENRFTKTILVNDLNEPMELAVAPDGRVFFIERAGKIFVYNPVTKKTQLVHEFEFDAKALLALNGLLGITLDPDFARNKQIYLFLTTPGAAPHKQNIARFSLKPDGTLNLESKQVLLEFPIDLNGRTHTGGSMAWDKNHNLYISTGDNTIASAFAPIDERRERINHDAQRTAANTNDLRGKILRIHPEPDGSYTIPAGNLFPTGTPLTRPEIYVMGTRNPYRISVDPATSILYWGEVGPDAGTPDAQGPRGYDELNQAKKAGNFGWPYFIGDNQPYKDYDFATMAVGEIFDVNGPANLSPNNTGLKVLPPAQKAMIWYPYDKSPVFPLLGSGGRSAMSGPVYHFDPNLKSEVKFPEYYDKALFFYDWMRSWIFTAHFDDNHNLKRLEPFMPTRGQFIRPMDIEIGPDGAFYILEYGTGYSEDNPDARLVRIDYNGGNRRPVAKITASDTLGNAPLNVKFSGEKSFDFDEQDKLVFEWFVNGTQFNTSGPQAAYTFQENGIYTTALKVTDEAGNSHTDTLEIKVGNTLPQLKIKTSSNSTFYFPTSTPLNYAVQVTDNEDKTIEKSRLKIQLKYIPKVNSGQPLLGDQAFEDAFSLGKTLMAGSDCSACHQTDKKTVGPAFIEVAKRYKTDKDAVIRLANKIIKGGGGVWGDFAMNAHPQLSVEDASEIVKYVLSLSTQKPAVFLPRQGKVVLNKHVEQKGQGRYILSASYTDNGGAIMPLTNTASLVLRPAKVQAEEADEIRNSNKVGSKIQVLQDQAYIVFKDIDLTGIRQVGYRFNTQTPGIAGEIRLGSDKGPIISTLAFNSGTELNKYSEGKAAVKPISGKHDLYFVFKKDADDKKIFLFDWVEFRL